MFKNPFTPIFGGRPEHFFGRNEILARFDAALLDEGSADRALFITGTRGSGKTALLEQLSRRAAKAGMRTVDVGAHDTVNMLMRSLQPHDEESHSVSPQVGLNVLGVGGSLGGISTVKAMHYDRTDLQHVFLRACEKERDGLFVSIDEVQKVDKEDLSAISSAFQMASRKGRNVMLAMAGLPYSHEEVIHHEGCTFMRRAVHEELGLFSWEEAYGAFRDSISLVRGLVADDEALYTLTRSSYGHPYVIQLLGYYAVLRADSVCVGDTYVLTDEDVHAVLPMAVGAYERRALQPLVEECTPQELAFLRGMSDALDEDRVARVAEVARSLGKEQRQLSAAREALIRRGTVIPVGRGRLMFNVPYLAAYMKKGAGEDKNVARVRSWRL